MQSLHAYLEHGNLLRVLAWSIMKLTWSRIDLGATWTYSCQELEFKHFLKITEKLNKSFTHWWIFLGRRCVLFNFVSLKSRIFEGSTCIQWETWVWSLGWEDPPQEVRQPLQCSRPENPHGHIGLAGYSPWDRKEFDTTERLSTAQYVFSNVYKWIDF